MQLPITYSLDHSTGKVELTLADNRLLTNTQGKGLLDKPKSIDIPLSDLKQFCLVPTIAAQNLQSPKNPGDFSYDSEFIFSYREGTQVKNKRLFVNSKDETFAALLQQLGTKRPDASLLQLPPAEAQKQMGVLSARKTVIIIICLLVGVPILIALIVILSNLL